MTDLGNDNIATSKMTGVLPANAKRTNKGRFAELKLLFAIRREIG